MFANVQYVHTLFKWSANVLKVSLDNCTSNSFSRLASLGFLGRHKAMPTSKFLKNYAKKFSLLCLKIKAFILFFWVLFFLEVSFSNFFPIIMDGQSRMMKSERPCWIRTDPDGPGRTRTELDGPRILCFPLWEPYFIKLFRADLQCNIHSDFFSHIHAVYKDWRCIF